MSVDWALIDDLENRVLALGPFARPRVTWLMDIDGVLNVIGSKPKAGWPQYDHSAVVAFDGLGWPITFAPTLFTLLNELHQSNLVSFRWLTTWEHDAPTRFAPAVGLDLGPWVAGEDDGQSPTWWKLDVFADTLRDADHLVIWTDDDIKDSLHAQQVVDFLHPEQALVISPDEREGLTPQEFDRILTAIERTVG